MEKYEIIENIKNLSLINLRELDDENLVKMYCFFNTFKPEIIKDEIKERFPNGLDFNQDGFVCKISYTPASKTFVEPYKVVDWGLVLKNGKPIMKKQFTAICEDGTAIILPDNFKEIKVKEVLDVKATEKTDWFFENEDNFLKTIVPEPVITKENYRISTAKCSLVKNLLKGGKDE